MNASYQCTPWFFPFVDEGHVLCDPWEANTILSIMLDDIPEEACEKCLQGTTLPYVKSKCLNYSYLNIYVKLQNSIFLKPIKADVDLSNY
jgi:hypothetical protein